VLQEFEIERKENKVSAKETAKDLGYGALALLLVPVGFGVFLLLLFTLPKVLLIGIPIGLILAFAFQAGKST
jgi:hypothetical protein